MGRNDRIAGNRVKNCWRSWVLEKVGNLSCFWYSSVAKFYVLFAYFWAFCWCYSGIGISGDPFCKFRTESPLMMLGKLQKRSYLYVDVFLLWNLCVDILVHVFMSCIHFNSKQREVYLPGFDLLIIETVLCTRLLLNVNLSMFMLSYNLTEGSWFHFYSSWETLLHLGSFGCICYTTQ